MMRREQPKCISQKYLKAKLDGNTRFSLTYDMLTLNITERRQKVYCALLKVPFHRVFPTKRFK